MDGFQPSDGFVKYIKYLARPLSCDCIHGDDEEGNRGAYLRLIPNNPHTLHSSSLFELSP